MNLNAYQDTDEGIAGVSVVSSGHIFAQKGRRISRPNGRSDFLLFYVAAGKELFFLDREAVAEEGSFIFFRPFERQEHVYTETKRANSIISISTRRRILICSVLKAQRCIQ